MRVLARSRCVVLSDTGGYAAGVFLGKHPMAPTVSPKKSWEGLGGSLVATGVGGALLVHYLFAPAVLARRRASVSACRPRRSSVIWPNR